eukprot:365401-Chlamydomonas_euryale.AAC.7
MPLAPPGHHHRGIPLTSHTPPTRHTTAHMPHHHHTRHTTAHTPQATHAHTPHTAAHTQEAADVLLSHRATLLAAASSEAAQPHEPSHRVAREVAWAVSAIAQRDAGLVGGGGAGGEARALALAELMLLCVSSGSRPTADAALDYFAAMNTVSTAAVLLQRACETRQTAFRWFVGRLGCFNDVQLVHASALTWRHVCGERADLVVERTCGVRLLHTGDARVAQVECAVFVANPGPRAQVPVAGRHPQLCRPLFASALPHLLRHAQFPEDFTTWAESDLDEDEFHRRGPMGRMSLRAHARVIRVANPP